MGGHPGGNRRVAELVDVMIGFGGGDGFANGLAHAFPSGKTPVDAVVHGALVQGTPGAVSRVTEAEVAGAIERKGAPSTRRP